MKFTIATVLAAATAVSAATLPSCGATCAINNLSKSTCSSAADQKCLCQDTTYQSAFLQCVMSSCNAADQQATTQYGTQLCAAAGVTIGASQSSSAAASTSASHSSSSSSIAAVTPVSSITTIPHTTTTLSSYVPVGTGSTVTAAQNGTQVSATSSAKPQAYTGAADALTATKWMGLVAFLGAVAL